MDTIKLKFTRLQAEIFRLLCIKAGSSINQNNMAKELKVSPTAISKAIKYLEKENLAKVVKSKTMNLILIELNRDNIKAMQMKRVENLKQIYESGLIEELEGTFQGATIILFGSFSRGDDTISSDIDLAVIGRKEKEVDLRKLENMFKRKIIINFYPNLKDIHKNLRENICNGIVLSGGVEL